MTYKRIHQLYRDKHSIRSISRITGLNWRTVKLQLSMSEEDFLVISQQKKGRKKVLLEFEDFVFNRLRNFPDTTSAQIHDLLKEHFPDFGPISPKTVYNFVMAIRAKYSLSLEGPTRQYQMVAELPYGQQAQVDFGFYNMRTSEGKTRKVQFFCMSLSRSRYKYVLFTDRPFTTITVIEAHEKAFCYFGGMPQELVYDQDRLFMVDENWGDLILTEHFRQYISQRPLKTYFCRAADPQSKGKIENVVKYVKRNFLYGRFFKDTQLLNEEVLAWLKRTANTSIHGTTKLIPAEEMENEVTFLYPYNPVQMMEPEYSSYAVRKDNTISWKSNFYSLPLGTYKDRQSRVLLIREEQELVILSMEKQELCRHIISPLKGQKILQTDHGRDKSRAIMEMMQEFANLFTDPKEALGWIFQLRTDKPRYIRDQIQLLKTIVSKLEPAMALDTLYYCSQYHIYSASDFKSVAEHLGRLQQPEIITPITITNNPLIAPVQQKANAEPARSKLINYDIIFN